MGGWSDALAQLETMAANRLRDVGGGVTLWRNGEEMALIELPIAGLMSDSPAAEVAAKAEAMVAAMKACGCELNNAYMQHSLLALVVIPLTLLAQQVTITPNYKEADIRQIVEAGENCRAGRCQPGHRLENGIDGSGRRFLGQTIQFCCYPFDQFFFIHGGPP